MKKVNFTPEQEKVLKNYYLITENGMTRLGDSSELTRESLRILWLNEKIELYELTAEDFQYYDLEEGDRDFTLRTPELYIILRKDIPNEVLKILDEVLNKGK